MLLPVVARGHKLLLMSKDFVAAAVGDNLRMAFFEGVSGAVFYRHWAVVPGRVRGTVVFLHGMGQHSGDYHHFAAALGAHGISVWALDHVGHGLTEGELGTPGPVPDLAANAGRLISRAVGAGSAAPIVLMGHSLGAGVALSLATSSPKCADGLILCGAPLGPGRRSVQDAKPESRERAECWAELRQQVHVRLAAMPVLVLHGEDDRIIPIDGVRATLDELEGVELVSYPDAGHDLLHEAVRDEVVAQVAQFVSAVR